MRILNLHLVGVRGDGSVAIVNPPKPGQLMTQSEALTLAAWLVVSATMDSGFDQTHADTFVKLVREIQEG